MRRGCGFALTVAAVSESPLLADIHAAAFPPHERWSSAVFSLQLALPNVIGFSDSANGLVLVRVAGAEAEVLTLAVRPTARRQRLGAALLEEGLVQVAARGASVLFLEVSVKNTAALALYRMFGFTQVGVRPRYYCDRTDALVLRLNVPSLPRGSVTAAPDPGGSISD
jgi:ribosomal-protein-alanine N-acetyltransferase